MACQEGQVDVKFLCQDHERVIKSELCVFKKYTESLQ